MEYILDFDNTLFDTARFVHDAKKEKESGALVTPSIWDTFDAASYVFDDVHTFLHAVGKDNVHILTAVTPSLGALAFPFQKEKLHRSGITDLVNTVTFMEGEKGDSVRKMNDGRPAIFIDDKIEQVVSVKKVCPHVETILIRRINPYITHRVDDTENAFRVISSLHELL